MTRDPLPPVIDLDPDVISRLESYAAAPRGNRSGRSWTLDELLPLLDPEVTVRAIAERLEVKRAVITYELVRMRRAGLPVPDRLTGQDRSPRALAIEGDVRAGMTNAEIARRHNVSEPWVWQVRERAGIAPCTRLSTRLWTEEERRIVIEHQRRPVAEVAELVGRTVFATYGERQRLIRQGLIRPLKLRNRNPAG